MKNIKLLALLMLVIAVTMLSFTSCDALAEITSKIPGIGKPEHQHIFTEATCTAPATCTECGATEGQALGHTEVTDAAVEATCTEAGLTEGKHCSVCNEVIKAQETIPAKGHDYQTSVIAPTCTEAGYTVFACACGESYIGDKVNATGHSYESVVTAPTCTVAGSTVYTCACGDTYTEEIEKLGHIDENLDIDCDREGCTGKVAPAADSKLSNFTANNLGSKLSTSGSYYVEGVIAEVIDARNGIFLLDDGTGEKFYFRLPKNAEDVAHANWTVKLTLGDKVQLYGKINKFTSNDAPNGQYWPAMQGPVVTILEQHPHNFTAVPADCFYPAYCVCGENDKTPLGHTDADADGICEACNFGSTTNAENIRTHYNDIKSNTDKNDTTNGTQTYDGTNFTVVIEKGTGSLSTSDATHMRVQKGNNLVINALDGEKIVSITFVASGESYVDELETFLTSTGYVCTVNGLEATIAIDSLESLTLANTSTKTARITNVKVVYEVPVKLPEPLSNAVLDCTTKDNRLSFSTEQQVWSQNGITLTLNRNEGNEYSDKAPLQFPSKGSLTLAGTGMKTIVIETGNTTYGTYISNCFNGQPGVASVSAKSGTVTIVLTEAVDVFKIDYLAKQGQIKTITINPEA